MRSMSLAAGVCALWSACAMAQTPTETPAPGLSTPTPAAAPAASVIPAGSPVILELARSVSSKTVKTGDMFPIRLATPILLNDRVVVPAGAAGEGQVVDAAASGALGRPAKLVLAARYLTVDGARVGLRGFRLGAAGKDNSNAIMAASFVPYVGLLAMFAHGGEIDVPQGALGQAKLASDLPVPGAPPTSAPAAADTPSPSAPAPAGASLHGETAP